MGQMMQDVRYALRQMRKSPGFALIAVVTLALGVGAATAVFSVIDAVMLRPLPFAQQDRLMFTNVKASAGYQQPWSYKSYVDARAQLKTFDGLAGYSAFGSVNMEAASGPVSVHAVKGTDNFFSVFGVKPMLGRTYLPGEDKPGKDDVAVLSYELWQTQFGGHADVIGRVVRLDGAPYTVIGVMPADFRFPLSVRSAVYTPLHGNAKWMEARGSHWLPTVGRLKDGVSKAQGEADLTRVLTDLARAYPDTDAGRAGSLVSLDTMVSGEVKKPLETLILAVMALLAIACVNVAGLLLARAVKREREMAMRAAVGAGRGRLVRQMLTESMLLGVMSSVFGVALAYGLLGAMKSYLVKALARGADVHVNGMVLGAAILFASMTAVLASLVPAIRLSGVDPQRVLKSGGAAGAGRGQHRLRASFIAAQVMLSLTLLIVAGLLLRSLSRARGADLGFDAAHILSLEIDLSPGAYAGKDPLATFYTPFEQRIEHLHGVVGAGLINMLPLQAWGSNSDVHIAGQPPYPANQEMLAEVRVVSRGYFDAMGIRMRGGRMLSPGLDGAVLDGAGQRGTHVVVNDAFQKKFFPQGGEAVGAHLDDNDKPEEKTGIVGMTTSVRQNLMSLPMAEMDYLMDSIPVKDRLGMMSAMTLVVRTEGDPRVLIPEIRSLLHDVDPTVPFHQPELMTEVVSDQLVMERMESWLFGVFAVIAVALALVGLYGLISHEVEIGARDIGVRMALGATRGLVMRLVLGRVLLLIGIGAGLGLGLAYALRKAIGSVVEMQTGRDAGVMVGLAAALIALGAVAAFFPAKRAASIEPMEALRSE